MQYCTILFILVQLSFFIFQNQTSSMQLTSHEIQEINSQISTLESEKSGDRFADMEIMDKIHNLKMKREGNYTYGDPDGKCCVSNRIEGRRSLRVSHRRSRTDR